MSRDKPKRMETFRTDSEAIWVFWERPSGDVELRVDGKPKFEITLDQGAALIMLAKLDPRMTCIPMHDLESLSKAEGRQY